MSSFQSSDPCGEILNCSFWDKITQTYLPTEAFDLPEMAYSKTITPQVATGHFLSDFLKTLPTLQTLLLSSEGNFYLYENLNFHENLGLSGRVTYCSKSYKKN